MSTWIKSSFCNVANCVEVRWLVSSFCHDGGCAQVKLFGDMVHLRDTERPHEVVTVSIESWRAFVAGVKAGEFDFGEGLA